ncbi:hypothetical protein scyTo_0020316, partial [Scyliorhinus torazame]|nr:hypothetical protein [Scyliorhinus torazame]
CYLREPLKNLALKQDNEFNKMLKNSEKQTGWLGNCKKHFCKIMTSKPDIIKGNSKYTDTNLL